MKIYCFTCVIVFSAYANQVDQFAQGLFLISQSSENTTENLYEEILKAYKNDKFDEVKKLLKNAPQDLFGVVIIDDSRHNFLMDIISGYKYPFSPPSIGSSSERIALEKSIEDLEDSIVREEKEHKHLLEIKKLANREEALDRSKKRLKELEDNLQEKKSKLSSQEMRKIDEKHEELKNKNIAALKDAAQKQSEIMEIIITKSKPEQLLLYIDNTVLVKAISHRIPTELVKQMLQEAPQLVDPDYRFPNTKKEYVNDVLENTIDNYSNGNFVGSYYPELPSIDAIVIIHNDIVAMIDAAKKVEKTDFAALFRTVILNFIQNYSANIFFNKDVKKMHEFRVGLRDILHALLQAKPSMVSTVVPWLLNKFIEMQKEGQDFLQPLVKDIVEPYKLKEMVIKSSHDNLKNKGLKEGESYTLDNILQVTGLYDLLK